MDGVLNVSNDKGVVGKMAFTNIRIVWFSTLDNASNVSIPHLQVASIRVQKSKYGPALCIETFTTPTTLTYKLGFQVPSEPVSKLKEMAAFVKSLSQAYLEFPIFGVQFEVCCK
ncbi:hypothetical protein HDU98_009415 [Podochytrium sp. JEL0797]|nr:hypothetical protein HDU98_009415 [Podochytrium sp. JEL0797]